nr:MAG TPA: hypothetical protein [Caudoviricetes sp.]
MLTRCALTSDTLSALASDPHTVGADHASPAWSAICCTVWHGPTAGRTPALSYIPYYNRRLVLTCTASLRGGGIWYRWRASGRVCVLQRGVDGIIAACVGLV